MAKKESAQQFEHNLDASFTPTDAASTDIARDGEFSQDHAPRVQLDEAPKKVKASVAGGAWVALILGALLLILLLVFILQNQHTAELNFLAWQVTTPVGVTILLAAIAGALVMALVGGVRILQLRRQVKRR